MTTAVETLARFVSRRRFQGVPAAVVHESKRAILNALAAGLAATSDEAVLIVDGWAGGQQPAPGQSPAHVLWRGSERTPPDAAFINGLMMHVLDFDETYVPALCHPSSPVLAAALAAAETSSASGQELLNAFAIGVQVDLAIARILYPSHYHRGFHISSTAGALGAAAAASVLLQLDEASVANALGVAMAGASGLTELFGTMTKAYQIGNSARTGVVAAELASLGFTGTRSGFDGSRGMLRAMSDEPADKIDAILASLDDDWPALHINYKLYPTGETMMAPLEGVLAIRSRIRPDQACDVERMLLTVTGYTEEVAGRLPLRSTSNLERPTAIRPRTPHEARFNLQYCVAAAWIAGKFGEAEMTPATVGDAAVLSLRDRVVVLADPLLAMDQCQVEVLFSDGASLQARVEHNRGSAANPCTDLELTRKLDEAGAGRLSTARARAVTDLVWQLDELPDAAAFLRAVHL